MNPERSRARPFIALAIAALAPLMPIDASQAGLNRWTTAGPEGGWVNAVVIDPRTRDVVYVGTSRGVFKSTVGGRFWTPVNRGLSSTEIFSLAIDPRNPATLYAGSSNQTFVISLTPTAAFDTTDVQFGFNCTNTDLAPTIIALNTLLLTASATPVPDIVALAATPSQDGIVNVPDVPGGAAFAVATVNVGATGAITATADTGTAALPMSVSLCRTNPATGQCLSAISQSATAQIDTGATPTFAVFVAATAPIPFDPANSRVFVRFKDGAGVTRGATSVAVRTE